MPLVQDSMAAELRSRLGDPSTSTLPDTQIGYALASAVNEWSRLNPRFVAVTFYTVQDQASYTLPANIESVSELRINPAMDLFLFPPVQEFPNLVLYPGIDIHDWARVERAFEDLGLGYSESAFWDWAVTPGDATADPQVSALLTLDPVPQYVRRVAAKALFAADLSMVPPTDKELLLQYAEGLCLLYEGRKRSKSVKRIPTAAGSLLLDTGESFRQEGLQLMREAAKRMGSTATRLSMG